MKTIEIKNAKDLNEYKSSNEISNLNFKNWSGGDIYLGNATTGNIYLVGATTRDIFLRGAKTGRIDLNGATTGYIDLRFATTGHIDLRGAKTSYINLIGAKTGNIYLVGARTGHIYLSEATTGYIDLRDVTTGDIDLEGATTGEIKQNYTTDDISFLKGLPLDIIDLSDWQSNENWKECKTIDELHTCGTTYCIRGYAESKYFIKNGKECEDKSTLYPNLKHLFHMTNEQFKEELKKILK